MDANTPQSRGLLSHVLSFVSREFESFVVNATARPENQHISTGRVKTSTRRRVRDAERNLSDDEARYRLRTYHRRPRERRAEKSDLAPPKQRSRSSDCRGGRDDRSQAAHVDNERVLSANETSPAPPRPPSGFLVPALPPKLKKQPSITMPGSLFPRSPSLLPERPGIEQCTPATLVVPISVQPSRLPRDDAEAGPSGTYPVDPTQPSLDEYASPWRTRSVASVKDAVHRFSASDGAEADFSLMLPSPHSSPAKPLSKGRAVGEASPLLAMSDPASPTTLGLKKGKERARDDDDLDFIVGGSAGVHAKERELDVAREEQREHERRWSGDQSRRTSDERERDQRRIRALEEEVRWLKEELSRSQARSPAHPSIAPPPPPPPPPPPLPPLPLRIDTTPYTPTSMFASARASLRHAMTPVEAPINNPGLNKTRRTGQPTVNVPSEKMAAFLHEIKTAKLRKVGSGLNTMGGDGVPGPSGLSKSVSTTTSSTAARAAAKLSVQELQRRKSLASLRVPIGSALAAPVPLFALVGAKAADLRAGQKRKVDALGVDEVIPYAAKRRMTELSAQFSSGTNQHATASGVSLPPPPVPTNETDLTTPSLCSDREENSIEDQVPSTPRAISPESVPRRVSDIFKKRPPTSPVRLPTPRRPSAPARTKRGATPRPKSLPLESDEDEEEPAPVPFVSLIPLPKSKPNKKAKPTLTGKGRPRVSQPNGRLSHPSSSASSTQNKRKKRHKRRQTLDEEMSAAKARSCDIDEYNDELDPEEKEVDVFTATGTRSSRRGFLAHGGGGGAPVFMGVGYVDGAEVESEDELAGPQPRRQSKPTSQASLIPRPKARV